VGDSVFVILWQDSEAVHISISSVKLAGFKSLPKVLAAFVTYS
jgi:hypothetical protein